MAQNNTTGWFPIVKNSWIWISLAIIWMIVSIFFFFSYAKYSIQFTGGIQISTDADLTKKSTELSKEITSFMSSKGVDVDVYLNTDSNKHTEVLIQPKAIGSTINSVATDLQNLLAQKNLITPTQVKQSVVIGPSVGEYLQSSAKYAVIRGIVLMTIYMIFAFKEVRMVISPVVLASITIFTMIFDVLSPMGIYGIHMMLNPTAQIDVIFVIAILTTMGYSINDTIIIFDRIRENIGSKTGNNIDYASIFESSLRQTMRRSMGTSISTFVVVLAMYIFGTGDLGRFAFSMMMGVISGTVSSIFLAAPLAYLIISYSRKAK